MKSIMNGLYELSNDGNQAIKKTILNQYQLKNIFLYLLCCLLPLFVNGQNNPPWERPLKIAWSADGTVFTNESIFQDSSGVPSAIRWKGDTMVCVFQWFRAPVGSSSWDRVAVKFSYDNGISWTTPVPVIVNGIPGNFQRPFDPTLARLNSDSLRIYFSSGIGVPPIGLDSSVNTYSAVSTDGISYNFEPGTRFDHPTSKAIDPAVLFFNGLWHYSSPAGAPQAGAYHAISPDGLFFLQQPDYPSDPMHNWTGNLLLENNNLMKFYGSGPSIWHNSTSDGFTWLGYTGTNLVGGDPSAVKITSNNYFIIFVGPPYPTGIQNPNPASPVTTYPNPADENLYIKFAVAQKYRYKIYDTSGKLTKNGIYTLNSAINIADLQDGAYFIELVDPDHHANIRHFIKQK